MESPASSSSQQTTPVTASSTLTSSQSTPVLNTSGREKNQNHERRHSGCVKEEKKYLKLCSPFGGAPIRFTWNSCPKKNCVNDIFDIIRATINFIPEIKEAVEKNELLKFKAFDEYEPMNRMCRKFSKLTNQYYKSILQPDGKTPTDYADADLLKLICTKAYNRSVENEKKLNKHYSAFSSQTYGETSYDRLKSIIEEIQPKENDIFLDLGSGVGNLVVQMAGGSKVKRSIGIEIADLPAQFAKSMEIEFKLFCKWFGKKYRPFMLHHGSFLDEKFRQLIQQEATIIFINNYAFTADLEDKIKHDLLSELKDGTRIISTKPYAVPNRQITHRQLGDIASIVDVSRLKNVDNPVSWTSQNVPYYLHVINRAKLEHYFASLKSTVPGSRSDTPCSKESRESSVAPNKNGIASRNGTLTSSSTPTSSVTPSANGDVYGPTTRKKWTQYCHDMEANKKGNSVDFSITDTEAAMDIDMRPSTPISTEASRARTASIVDTIASVADGTAGTIKQLVSPPLKKAKKESPEGAKVSQNRGRPRKNGSQPKNQLSREAREGIELLHNLTREACKHNPMEAVFDPAFILTDVQSSMKKSVVKAEVAAGPNKYPNLDSFMNELKAIYVKFLDSLQTEEFVRTLQKRDHGLEHQINDQGVAVFKESMKQQGIDLEKPKTTLEKAKRFLQRYNNVVEIVENLESEMALMESDSKELIADYSATIKAKQEPEEHHQPVAPQVPLQLRMDPHTSSIPPATPSAVSVHSIRNVPQQPPQPPVAPNNVAIDQLFINNLAENFNQNSMNGNFLQNTSILQALANLDSSMMNTSSVSNSSNSLNYSNTQDLLALLQQGKIGTPASSDRMSAGASNFPLFNNGNQNIAAPTSSVQAPISMCPVNTNNQPSTSMAATAPVIAEINGKKPRARTVRAPSNKKNSVSKEDDPAKKEEIDKRIMDIVQLALEVDKSAKSQEKDRKARSSDKRTTKDKTVANSSPPNANGTIAGKKRTSTEAALNLPPSTSSVGAHATGNTPHTTASFLNNSNNGLSAVSPFSSPNTSISNSMQPNLLYYQRIVNGGNPPMTNNYNPPAATPVSSTGTGLSPDLMNLIANNANGAKDIVGDAIQSFLRMDGSAFANLLGQNGLTSQYQFNQQTVNQLMDSVNNAAGNNSPAVQVPGSTSNGNGYSS